MVPSRMPVGLICALLALLLVVAPGRGADPSAGPAQETTSTPAPTQTPAPTSTPRPVPGDGGLAPGLHAWEAVGPPYLKPFRQLSDLVAWQGGFAVLEKRWGRNDIWAAAVWHSPDGRAWTRTRLPTRLPAPVAFLPFRGGLVIVTDERPVSAGFGVAYGFWRSDDAREWRRVGSLGDQVVEALPGRGCDAGQRDFVSIDGALVLYVSYCAPPCCGSGPRPGGAALALAAPTVGLTQPAGGVMAWRSTDGADWRQQPLRGMDPAGGRGYRIDVRTAPGEVLVLRSGRPSTLLRSRDGIRFRPFGRIPPGLRVQGSLEFVPLGASVLLLGESDAHEGGDGNILAGWVLEKDGTTTETLVRQPAFTRRFIADGTTVVVIGDAWNDGDERWMWMIGSRDGGRTWDEDLSWTGSAGSCFGDLAVGDGVLVMEACSRSGATDPPSAADIPAFWLATQTSRVSGATPVRRR